MKVVLYAKKLHLKSGLQKNKKHPDNRRLSAGQLPQMNGNEVPRAGNKYYRPISKNGTPPPCFWCVVLWAVVLCALLSGAALHSLAHERAA